MQYHDTLPLADKEVVLTFDDGPIQPHTGKILDILAAECVKATYFLVGEMARAYPDAVRRIHAEGHTIGTHSEHHPLHFERLSEDRRHHEIDDAIADVSAALGDPREVAPFFRFPGLARSNAAEAEFAARSFVVFSSDTVADDWHRHIKPAKIVSLAISRLEARHKGILLLHDIHATTAEALPELLKQLKEHGFHIVHVVPAAPAETLEVADTLKPWTEAFAGPDQIIMDDRSIQPTWPELDHSPIDDAVALPAPDASAYADDPEAVLPTAVALYESRDPDWPTPSGEVVAGTIPNAETMEMPVPGLLNIGVPWSGQHLVGEAAESSRHAEILPAAEHATERVRSHHGHRGRGSRQHAAFNGWARLTALLSPGRRVSQ